MPRRKNAGAYNLGVREIRRSLVRGLEFAHWSLPLLNDLQNRLTNN
jgi:hypothetical protein